MLYLFFLAICCHLIVIYFIFFEDHKWHNGNKSCDFLCIPRFIVYMYFIMICIHYILLYMLMVDPIKSKSVNNFFF